MQMSDLRATLEQARKRLRHKLGLRAAPSPDAEPSEPPPSDGSGSGVSVLHRVLAFEDHQQDSEACTSPDSDIIPLPAALSHSLSGTWKQRIDDTGKPVWQRDAREAGTTEVSSLANLQCHGVPDGRGHCHSFALYCTLRSVPRHFPFAYL